MVTETDTETKPKETVWLQIQIDGDAPSLGDLGAWLAAAATAWIGPAPLTACMNYQDLGVCMITPTLQKPLTAHGIANFKLTPAN